MHTILITGSNGLIGKLLCQKLEALEFNVKKCDTNYPLHSLIHGDIRDFNSIRQHVQNCDGIVHLAGVSRVIWGQQDPENCWQSNVVGTKNVLEAALNSSRKPWVIYASSREVYGQQSDFPVTESSLLQPLNFYARSKVAAEELTQSYLKKGLNTAILRLSSVYGCTDDHSDRVIPAFCHAAAFGRQLRIEGYENTFDFTHVMDVTDGFVNLIQGVFNKQQYPAMHLTTGKPTTLYEAAQLACQSSKTSATIIETPPRNFDVAKFYADPALARQLIQWEPKIDVAKGIYNLVQSFMQTQNNLDHAQGSVSENP